MKLNRKPNYRAWLNDKHEMINVYDFVRLAVVHSNESDYHVIEYDGCGNFSEHDNFELMEFTGLIDKYGREIFEGDIIAFPDCDDDRDVYTASVVWDNSRACFGVTFDGNLVVSFDDLAEYYTELRNIEIIGNIYEDKDF